MRLSLCNEVIRDLPFERQCALAAILGYDGLEIAPFTLTDDPRRLTDQQTARIRAAMTAEGLVCTGLHWLLVTPANLSITSADAGVQADTLAVIQRLCVLAAELGARVLVHGSPGQRMLPADPRQADAARSRAMHLLDSAGRAAEQAGVIYCLEPLARAETNFANTIDEAAAIVSLIAQPNLRTMIDCSAAGTIEADTVADLIRRWMPSGMAAHIQVNDPNRKGPGQGDMVFAPIIDALLEVGYEGDIAVEPFIYEADGPTCAARAAGYLRGLLEAGAARMAR